jgi:polyhydroxyalkanoate synthesis regulator phasin
MNKGLKKVLLAGLGAAVSTEEAVKKTFSNLVKKGEMNEKDFSKAMKEVVEKAKKGKENFQKTVESEVKKIVKNLNLATQDDLKNLEKKISKKKK